MFKETPRARSAAAWLILFVLGCLCVSDAGAAQSTSRVCTNAVVVLPTEPVLAYERSPQSLPAHERFEFSRRDRAVGVVRTLPLEAQRQWPEPPKPTERRIIFEQWRQ